MATTLGSFMTKNNFDALRHDTTVSGKQTTTSLADTTRTLAGTTAHAVATSACATTTSPADHTTKTPTTGATTTDRTVAAVTTSRKTIKQLLKQIGERQIKTDVPQANLVNAVHEAEEITKTINSIEYTETERQLCTVDPDIVKIRVALDSAACDNVIDPNGLPNDAEFEPNENDKHFKGANDSHIERYGSCKTIMNGKHGEVGCNWQMAAVSRALHSAGVVAGPKDGPGKQDILFNNEKAFVVAPGIVGKIMEHCKAVAEYDREGNLYVGEMTLQSFHRQGAQE